MTANKRKKNTRARANTTHGYGSMKKHRGAGSRGGRGNAGSGKRGDAKKPTFRVKTNFELGKNGFGVRKEKVNAVNLSDITEKLETWMSAGVISKEKDFYVIDLDKLKIQKLLGRGSLDIKLKINVRYASAKAVEKIKQAGGSIDVFISNEVESSSEKQE